MMQPHKQRSNYQKLHHLRLTLGNSFLEHHARYTKHAFNMNTIMAKSIHFALIFSFFGVSVKIEHYKYKNSADNLEYIHFIMVVNNSERYRQHHTAGGNQRRECKEAKSKSTVECKLIAGKHQYEKYTDTDCIKCENLKFGGKKPLL